MTLQPHPAAAVVTGASSGIGAIYADRLSARGYKVVLVARRADRLDSLADEIQARHGQRPETWVADLSDPIGLARIEARMQDLDLGFLVNNAGVGALGPSANASAGELDRLIRLNIMALTRLSLAALGAYRRSGRGTLVNIGSIMAFQPSAGGAAYSGSKAYVANFTRSLQLEYAQGDIRIQLVAPGPIRTEFFTAQGLTDAVFPDHYYLTPEQLVDAALVGLDAGEAVTIASLADPARWDTLEAARLSLVEGATSGAVAVRYLDDRPNLG